MSFDFSSLGPPPAVAAPAPAPAPVPVHRNADTLDAVPSPEPEPASALDGAAAQQLDENGLLPTTPPPAAVADEPVAVMPRPPQVSPR